MITFHLGGVQRNLETKAGEVTLRVPRWRPEFFAL
jgi:hypothetical protein